jgi:hypothetical protein
MPHGRALLYLVPVDDPFTSIGTSTAHGLAQFVCRAQSATNSVALYLSQARVVLKPCDRCLAKSSRALRLGGKRTEGKRNHGRCFFQTASKSRRWS